MIVGGCLVGIVIAFLVGSCYGVAATMPDVMRELELYKQRNMALASQVDDLIARLAAHERRADG